MGKWLIVLPMLWASAAAAAPAWTWVDADGRRHYSDRPVPGAEQIELAGAQGFSLPPAAQPSEPRAAARAETSTGEAPAVARYTAFDIVSPAHQETLWNIGGELAVAVRIEPGLEAGHRIDAILDGQRVIIGSARPELTVPDVFRGVHTLQAVIMDASGREVLRTVAITIMVQQTSLLNPNNPNAPGP